MTGCEGVVGALFGIGKTAKTAKLAIGVKLVAATCEQLVPIGLMPDIPHNAVVGGVEHIVQCHGELHRTHARCKVPGIGRQGVYKEVAYFGADCR